ncbi:MAG: DUF4139 domain-containing protein [Brevundimonas sp.]
MRSPKRALLALTVLASMPLALTPAPVAAQQPSGPERLALTIYNQNLALVEDVRRLTLPAGRSRQEFPGVSASIRPETVSRSGAGLSVVEQNFDFDLLTPDKLMTAAVGDEIGLVRINPATGSETELRARVLAANEGVVLQIGDRIEVLRDDGVPTRVIFDEVPANLLPRPTLSVTLDADRAGPRETTLSYLTTGLSWRADYVIDFDEAAGRMDLTGWITLTNQSGVTFTDADTRLVAGELNMLSGLGSGYRAQTYGTDSGEAEDLADYYIYPIPERVTVANNQTKQVGLYASTGVPARKRYRAEFSGFGNRQPSSAEVAVVFDNSRASGLGRALPSGIVRVYMDDVSGQSRFVGEDGIGHTSAGAEVAITTGSAFDVTVQTTVLDSEIIRIDQNNSRTRYEMAYDVRNARREPVTVEVRQIGLGRNGRLISESQTGERPNADTRVWQVRVPANGTTRVTATFEIE